MWVQLVIYNNEEHHFHLHMSRICHKYDIQNLHKNQQNRHGLVECFVIFPGMVLCFGVYFRGILFCWEIFYIIKMINCWLVIFHETAVEARFNSLTLNPKGIVSFMYWTHSIALQYFGFLSGLEKVYLNDSKRVFSLIRKTIKYLIYSKRFNFVVISTTEIVSIGYLLLGELLRLLISDRRISGFNNVNCICSLIKF